MVVDIERRTHDQLCQEIGKCLACHPRMNVWESMRSVQSKARFSNGW
jgi:hypothetical protein